MFDPMWESVYRLERLGLKVLGVCCDGLAANRRLFNLHSRGSKEPVYKVLNPHAEEERYLYFLSDPPHLMKTVRNCWTSKKRSLWVSGIMLGSMQVYINYILFIILNSVMGNTYRGLMCQSCIRQTEQQRVLD